jgi:hypothetical protein
VDLDWKDGKLAKAVIHSTLGNRCVLSDHELGVMSNGSKPVKVEPAGSSQGLSFETEAGVDYLVERAEG